MTSTSGTDRLTAGGSHRLHPLTPFVRGWRWLAVVVAILAGDPAKLTREAGPLGLAALALLVVGVGYGFLSWRVTRYTVTGGDLRIESGIVFRRSRRVRLDRLQAIDVVRPLVARALGLAELKLDMAAGEGKVPLAYLSDVTAQRLRAELLALAAGLEASTPEAPERPLIAVPAWRLGLVAMVSPTFFVSVVWIAATVTIAVLSGDARPVTGALPGIVGVVAATWQSFQVNFGFTVAESPDGLRLRRGLMETRAQTVPPGRVQAVRLAQPLLWRPLDWVKLEINVAGLAHGGREERRSHNGVLLPVGTRAEATALVGRVLPGVDIGQVAMAPAPRRSRWRSPVLWRGYSCGSDGGVFVARRGVLRREVDIIRHEKVQSVRITMGPWQRLLGLATVHLDSTPGPVHVAAEQREAVEARTLLDREATVAREARATAVPDRWMVPRPGPAAPSVGSAPSAGPPAPSAGPPSALG